MKTKIYGIRTTLFLVVLLTAIIPECFSQSPKGLVDRYMEKYNESKIDPDLINQILKENNRAILTAFAPYLSDSVARTRSGAFQMVSKIGTYSENKSIKTESVKMLVNGLNDEDGGVVGTVVNYLREFKPGDFNAEQRYNISMKVKALPAPAHLDKLILLTGYLNIDELIYNYKKMLADSVHYRYKETWNMRLAMARMGDEESMNYVLRRIKKLPINDDVVYDIYPNLAYIRQKESFDILFDNIISKDKNCISSNPDNEAEIICAFRILQFTAQYIENFPIKTDKYGDLIIDNYNATLTEVRQWITENRDNYSLKEDVY